MPETPDKIKKDVKEFAREARKALYDKEPEENEKEILRQKARAIIDFMTVKGTSLDALDELHKRCAAVEHAIAIVAEEEWRNGVSERDIYEWIFGYKTVKKLLDMSVEQLVSANDAPTLLRKFAMGKLAFKNPEHVLESAYGIKERWYGVTAIKIAAERNPAAALQHADRYKDQPYAREIIMKAAEGYSAAALQYADRYKDQPYAREIIMKAAERNPAAALQHADRYKDQPYAAEILEKAARNAAEHDPISALRFADRYKDQPYAREIIMKAAEGYSFFGLQHADRYKDQPYAREIIMKAAEHDPAAALQYADHYKDQPYAAEILEKAARNAAERYSVAALLYAGSYKDQPYAREIIMKAAERNPAAALLYADRYKDQPYAAEILEKAARKAAERNALQYAGSYKDQPYAREIIMKAAEHDPATALKYYNRISDILTQEKKPAIQKLNELAQSSFRNRAEMSALLHAFTYEGMSFQEANDIIANRDRFTHELIRLIGIPRVIGRDTIEYFLRSHVLRVIQGINARHDMPDQRRFEMVRASDASSLYTMMVYGEEEVFTSSFNGLFRRMLDRMKQENLSGDALLERVGHNKFHIFIKMCVSFNRLGEFLETMDDKQQKEILRRFTKDLEGKADSLEQAMAIAETFAALRDPVLLATLQRNLRAEYERVKQKKDQEGMKLYGLLAGMFGKGATVDSGWYRAMGEKYRIENVTKLSANELFNPDGSNIQHHFFYNDIDGQASFGHFLRQYRERKGWQLEEKDTYVRIVSKGSGRRSIEIYANKPEHEEEGREAIEKIFTKRGIERIVVVHRGHSYHAGKTIEHITERARIIALGSCGGYNNVSAVLDRSTKAHILSTKGTGTMSINDPILRIINESILGGSDIDWPSLWERAERQLGRNPDFRHYVPPHRNLGVMFLKAYRNL